MAAAVVALVVEDFLQTLSLGMDQLGPQWGVEPQLREIDGLLSSVQGVLPQAERKFPCSFELQEWVAKLKDAVYDAEDLLEELSLEEPLRLRDGKLRRLFRHVERCMFGWRMRWKLGAIAGRLRGLTDPLIGIIRSIPAVVQAVREAQEIPIVGRDNEKGELIRFLLDGGNSFVVVDGGWGCGKTALVKELMKDSGVSDHFDFKIWVNGSAAPLDTNRMVQEIIGSLREDDDQEGMMVMLGWQQSLKLLARLLDARKRYLFVLDDIFMQEWYPERILSFIRLLVGGGGRVARGSQILLVCDWETGRLWSRPNRVYIGRMDKEDALVLLKETASQGRDGYHDLFNHNPVILEIWRDIIDECIQGNPRKIKAVGGYLSHQPPADVEDDWSRLVDMLRHSRDSAFSALLRGGYPYSDLTSPAVKSYNNLPPWIKRCFSLCYLFPRGHPINTLTLTQLWISLGFIRNEPDSRQPLEDIAYRYLDVLLQEELFRVKKSDTFGKVKSVAIHPHAHELLPSVAGWECLAYLAHLPVEFYARQYARHRSLIHEPLATWRDDFPNDKLRTFLHFVEDSVELEELYRQFIPKLKPKRNRMRVLDLHNMKADVLPEVVWKLKHLRYLDLSGNGMLQMLPPAITGLLKLQTLKLSGCSSLTELPRDMNNLSDLRHLYIDGCWKLSLIPRGLCDLQCLNILTDFILPSDDSSKTPDSASLADLCKLNDLRGSIEIRNLGCYDEQELKDEGTEGLMDKKSHLESIELRFTNLSTDTSLLEKLQPHPNLKGLKIHNYGGTQFPEWMVRLSTHLPNLVEIVLIGCENCMYLPMFGHLPYLKKLTIQGLPDLEHMESASGQNLPEDANGARPFGNLTSFCIKDCPKLYSLPMIPHLLKLTLVNVSETIFRHPCQLPNLKTLSLENIEFLDHLTEEWLRGLISLKELHIGSCPSLVSLMPGISHLKKLETLSIWNCKALDLSKDEHGNIVMELHGLTRSLQCLTIYKALKMEHLPVWLSHVSTLRFLCLRSCPRLVVIPEWIGRRRSLNLLELIDCHGLASLPGGMQQLNNIYPKKLTVVGCPLLEIRGGRSFDRL